MSKTIYEKVEMDVDLPMRILHFSPNSPLLAGYDFALNNTNFIPPHWHRAIELTYIIEGGVHVRTGDAEKTYADASFFIINSGDIHEVSNVPSDRFDLICFIISYDFLNDVFPNIDTMRFDMDKTLETHPQLSILFTDILSLFYEKKEYNHLKIQAKLFEVLAIVCEHHQIEPDSKSLKRHFKLQAQNKKILEYIHEHYAENITLEILANEFHFSREHFSRLFKETFGKTFLSYLMDYRMYRAFPEIVNSDKTIAFISSEHGFLSSKSLINQFKEKYHETPIQYRKKHSVVIIDHNEIKSHQ